MPLHAEVRHIMLTVTDGLGSQLLKVIVDDKRKLSCFGSIEPAPLPAKVAATRRSSASSQGRCLRDPVGGTTQDPPWPRSSFPLLMAVGEPLPLSTAAVAMTHGSSSGWQRGFPRTAHDPSSDQR
jgi:hypothetical protein